MRGFYLWPCVYTAIGIGAVHYLQDPWLISIAFLLVLPPRIWLAYRVMHKARRRAARYANRYGTSGD